MWCYLQSEEEVPPEQPATFWKTDVVLDQECSSEQLVRVRRNQRMNVVPVDGIVHIRLVDCNPPLGPVGAGLLTIKDISVGSSSHRIACLERARVKLVVVIHEQHVFPMGQLEPDVAWLARPTGMPDAFDRYVAM